MIARLGAAVVLVLILEACAHTGPGALPAGVATDRDVRGAYRAALCARDGDACARILRAYDGETPSVRPPAAAASRYRLLFVPGFLASCFPGIHSFTDVVEAARAAGFAADVLAVGGRNDVASNALLIADQVERMTMNDTRRLILVGHSKGADEILQMLVARPDLAARVDALLTVAGALQGSPLADDLHALYGISAGVMPFEGCDRGQGDPIADLQPAVRTAWWKAHGGSLRTPIYSIVTLPDLSRLSLSLLAPYAWLSSYSPDNDGMLRVQDQVVPSSRLLGIVNADHLSVAIPHPGILYLLVFSPVMFPRPQVYLAAIDVIASERP